MADRPALARRMFDAFAAEDRDAVASLLADDFTFSSPADVGLDREGYFARCWPNAGLIEAFDLQRVIAAGDEVVVTYEATKADGSRFRNTEVLTFAGDRLARVEVYFGWTLD